jgi:flagellar motor component MotA
LYTQIASFVGGGYSNPFFAVSEIFNKTGPRMLLATGGAGIFMVVVNEDLRKDVANLMRDLKRLFREKKQKRKRSSQQSLQSLLFHR